MVNTETFQSFQRIYGENRYETSHKIADSLKKELNIGKFKNIIIASGDNFSDALSGSYLSIVKKAPIILFNKNNIDFTVEYVRNNLHNNGTIYVIGGTLVVSDRIENLLSEYNIKRLAGFTRYETNLNILKEAGINSKQILVCSGTGYADGISASATGKPILLVGQSLTTEQIEFLLKLKTSTFYIIGGIAAVNEEIELELKKYGNVERIGGDNRYETSVLIAEHFFSNSNSAVLAYAKNFPDGLCAGSLAYHINAPIILTAVCSEKKADEYASKHNIRSGIVIGGDTLVSDETANIIFTDKQYSGHEYIYTIHEPTCISSGFTEYTCVKCKYSYQGNFKKTTDHQYKTTKIEATTAWEGYDYHECLVCGDSYKDGYIGQLSSSDWPKGYKDDTCTIIVYKEWFENAYVYAAHIIFTDYDRLWVECSKGKYNSGGETTSKAAKRVGAILAINGDYAVPSNGAGSYAIARKGVVYNDKVAYPEGIYNSNTGLLTFGHSGRMISELVAEGLATDTFQFGPVCLKNGEIIGDPASTSRAQRTFIGTNGDPGDIWLCVSDGRSNDGKSTGLNPYQCGAYMKNKECTLCVPLDGGGSSTIYFNGQVLNAAKNNQRAVVDFVVFK